MDLNPGEVICPKCNGNMVYYFQNISEIKFGKTIQKVPGKIEAVNCSKCFGSGKLDWVEVIVGKRYDPYSMPFIRKNIQN